MMEINKRKARKNFTFKVQQFLNNSFLMYYEFSAFPMRWNNGNIK